MKDKVKSWLIKGANTQEGVKLMEMSAATELGLRLVRIYPDACRSFMITTLCRLYSISEDFLVKNERVVYQPKVNPFRSEFPFLGRPGCPVELEALASRKITRFYDYVRLHSQLRDCTTAEECATIARDLIDSYIDNRMIWAELNYYQAHKSLLGNILFSMN